MRIPKRVNAVLDWTEQHFGALAVVVALIVVALVATLAPPLVGFPVAGFVLGVAAGGFLVHVRMSRRVARSRAEVDDLLRENGALRHRNTILTSGVISRGAQETQALVSIPEDDEDLVEDDPARTAALPELTDELLGGPDDQQGDPGDTLGEGTPLLPGESPQDAERAAEPAAEPEKAQLADGAKGADEDAGDTAGDTAGNARRA